MTTDITQKPHPLSGQQLSGAEIVMQVIADEGIDTLFGYSGGAILPTYDAIFRFNEKNRKAQNQDPIRLIVPANEQGAGFMAAGYARASGKVGVAVVTSGPGATNAVTPIADCKADSVPMVLITGQVARGAIGSDAFQEVPLINIMTPVSKHCFLVTKPEKLESTIRTAFELARSGRPGPVVVDIPKDVQNWVGEFKGEGTLDIHGYWQRMHKASNQPLSKAACQEFFDLLQAAKRPLFYAGGGVIRAQAHQELTEFSKRFEIPIVTTLMGIGAIDTKEEHCLHMLGMHGTAYANYAVEDCDLLIAIGSRFDDRVAGNIKEFAKQAKIIHFDIDPSEIGKVKLTDWHHVGDVKDSLNQLMTYGQAIKPNNKAWLSHVASLKQKHTMNYDRKNALIQPQAVIELLNEHTKGEAIISTGVGQHQMWAAQFFDFKKPGLWITSGSMGTMGFGLPAAIGAQFAYPNKTVIDIDGDGSIRMNWGDMETITNYNLPVKVLVMNNNGDGMVRQWQKLFFSERFSASDKSLHKKDFVKSAQADGFKFAQKVKDKKELAKAIKDFADFEGPAFLEVMIDPDACVYPMVGPGMSYKQMVTGDFIESREAPKKSTKPASADSF